MNRRSFTALALSTSALITRPAKADDIRPVESPLMELFHWVPDRPGEDELQFPPTYATNLQVKRQIGSESPDMYWDPYGADLNTLFGFSSNAQLLTATQFLPHRLELWSLDTQWADAVNVSEKLQTNGWQIMDDDLRILHYRGSDEDRHALGMGMNFVSDIVYDGGWDYIALPNDNTIVLGAQDDVVRTTADRVKYYTAMTTLDQQFHNLGSVLPLHAYDVLLLPPKNLPITNAISSFVCKSWHDEATIIHSIGVRTSGSDESEQLIEDVRDLMAARESPVHKRAYETFLTLMDIHLEHAAVRFDFAASEGEWDVMDALSSGDLLMFPYSG